MRAMGYSLPFDLPPARGEAQPQLSLTYSSSASEREAGYGWGISLPHIERRPLSGWPRKLRETLEKGEVSAFAPKD